jgi:dihydropyrimidinase
MVHCDLVIKGGLVATESAVVEADVGITGETVVAIAKDLPMGRDEIDARGKIVTPGGVDSHCHIEQLAASGLMNADTFETATVSAAMGGTTTVIPFAAQHVGMSLSEVVADYHQRAAKGAVVDYAFHMILADPRPEILANELPALVEAGHSSLKVFLTYDRLRVDDEQFLEVLWAARRHGCMVCVHAENHGMISWMGKKLIEMGLTAPRFHVPSHPRLAEAEAINRAISMAVLLDQPIMIFHVSTAEGAAVIRRWQGQGAKVFGETCTQYLTLTAKDLDKPDVEGGMWICSPPLREVADQEALWQALGNGTLSTVSSDHAPYRMDETGKLAKGANPTFKEMANGMGGLEFRLPVLFDAMVRQGRMDLRDFVRLSASEPARIYGLAPRKGSIAIGSDADLVVWDPAKRTRISHDTTHDHSGYSAYAGREIEGWPTHVVRRGSIIVVAGRLAAAPGSGRFLPRAGGEAARPSGRATAELALLLAG